MKYARHISFAAMLVGSMCCSRPGHCQTAWAQPITGDWFDAKNWTLGVPSTRVAAVIGDGIAQASGRGVGPVSAGGLTIGQDSPLGGGGQGNLEVAGFDVNVRGPLILGQSRGQSTSGAMSVRGNGFLGGDVVVTGSVFAGFAESGKGLSSGVAKISGNLAVDPDRPPSRLSVDLAAGVNRGAGAASGELVVEGSVAGFDNVIIGWNDKTDLGTANGRLRTSVLRSTGNAAELAVGLNTGRGGLADGQLEVGEGIEGFERIRIGQSEGGGQANGLVKLQGGQIRAGTLQIGQLKDLSGSRGRSHGVLQLDGADFVGSVVEIGTNGQLLAQGRISGLVTNAGVVEVLPGARQNVLSVNGDYRQLSSGELRLDVAGPNAGIDHDVMAVSGVGELGGRLHLNFDQQFKPSIGQRFDVVTAKQLTGKWQVTVENPPAEFALKFDQTDSQYRIELAKPTPHEYRNPIGEQILWSDPTVWAGDRIPSSTDRITLENKNNQPQQLLIGNNVLVQDLAIRGAAQPMNLFVSADAQFSATHGLTIQQGGLVTLDKGKIAAAALDVRPGGALIGQGTLVGDIVNQGRMLVGSPGGISSLSIQGDYVQQAGGLLDFDIAGREVGEFDSLTISGRAQLGGRLSIDFAENIKLEPGLRIPLLVAEGGLAGEFTVVDLPIFEDIDIGVAFGDTTVVVFMQLLSESDRGDMDRNDVVNECDIDDFALGLGDPDAYFGVYNFSPGGRGNVNQDGEFDFDDIEAFLGLASGVPCETAVATIPEPRGMNLLLTALPLFILHYHRIRDRFHGRRRGG